MALFELEVALFASARALSGVLSTHRSLPGAVTAIFEVHGAISAHFPTALQLYFLDRKGHVIEVGCI